MIRGDQNKGGALFYKDCYARYILRLVAISVYHNYQSFTTILSLPAVARLATRRTMDHWAISGETSESSRPLVRLCVYQKSLSTMILFQYYARPSGLLN